eukprot:TRINITY_DN8177_c0_g1_i1.p1 TRINITY_DN8177_c0_g1~~TRINITY_DN8177_c0_g1_i1.p1  ORF type:complete len:821 (-),score=114.44 TRINITY_DN8177_c0_g1_i1:183-2645(-)
MFQDKFEPPVVRDLPSAPKSLQGLGGKSCTLYANSFKLVMNPAGSINHYRYHLAPPAKTLEEERWAIEEIWAELRLKLGYFIVRTPGHIFSPKAVHETQHFQTTSSPPPGFETHVVVVSLFQTHKADQVNKCFYGEAQVVVQHVVKSLTKSRRFHRVGRRCYHSSDANDGKSSLVVFSGLYTALGWANRFGPRLDIDTVYRAQQKKTVTDTMATVLEADDVTSSIPLSVMTLEDDAKSEWRDRCVGAMVVTIYNSRMYRIKAVRFDMTPKSVFTMRQRELKKVCELSYLEYYTDFYESFPIDLHDQPLLEACPDRESEQVFLVPELCRFTGFNEEMRKDKTSMADACKLTKVSPQERYNAIIAHTSSADTGSEPDLNKRMLQEWKFTLDKKPLEVEARILDSLDVKFGPKKYCIEEGSFQRWMRNGLQCPTQVHDWMFIYPESDVKIIGIWLRSLRDIAQVAFGMKMSSPKQLTCSEDREDLEQILTENVTPSTQLILLLAPQKGSKRVYQLFKQMTCVRFPCVTQVVKSKTVRKRQSVAAVLSKIVLQLNAKLCGPLWHIDLDVPGTSPLFSSATMVVGIDVFKSGDGDVYMGFAASLDKHCSEYYSIASKLEGGREHVSMSMKIQEALRDALLNFTSRNDELLPEHFVVYRASATAREWAIIRETEIEALLRVLQAVKSKQGDTYQPRLTFVAIEKYTGLRFFAQGPTQQSVRNPEPGTVIDHPIVNREGVHNFFLINQAVARGTTCPTHYTVLYDEGDIPMTALQNLSYRLSFLYFNFTGSVRLPAPAQYAKKIAHFVGSAVRQVPQKRLLCTFFYL